jgi:hypothetical protein
LLVGNSHAAAPWNADCNKTSEISGKPIRRIG